MKQTILIVLFVMAPFSYSQGATEPQQAEADSDTDIDLLSQLLQQNSELASQLETVAKQLKEEKEIQESQPTEVNLTEQIEKLTEIRAQYNENLQDTFQLIGEIQTQYESSLQTIKEIAQARYDEAVSAAKTQYDERVKIAQVQYDEMVGPIQSQYDSFLDAVEAMPSQDEFIIGATVDILFLGGIKNGYYKTIGYLTKEGFVIIECDNVLIEKLANASTQELHIANLFFSRTISNQVSVKNVVRGNIKQCDRITLEPIFNIEIIRNLIAKVQTQKTHQSNVSQGTGIHLQEPYELELGKLEIILETVENL